MKRGRVNVLATAAAFALLAFGAAGRHREPMLLAASQCTADTDCKGDRICSAGRCIEPQAASPVAPAPKANVPTPGPGAARMPKDQLLVCSDDRDCGGGLVCRRGDCISAPPPASATPRAAPVPANFSAPAPAANAPASSPAVPLLPGHCVNDVDCSGDAVCTHGACIFPQSGPVAPAAGIPEKFKAPNILSVRRFGGQS